MVEHFKDRTVIDDRALDHRYRSLFDIDRLHVRGVHDTWGIADGFVVALVGGGSALEISEGTAYDNEGTPLELRGVARLEPERPGEHEIVVRDGCAVALPSPRTGWCHGTLVLGSVTAVHVDTETLHWSDLRLRARWARRRQSAYVRAGSEDFKSPQDKVVVTTTRARFPRTPLYFCEVAALDTPAAALGTPPPAPSPHSLWTAAALERDDPKENAAHGPFFTICAAAPDTFTVRFTRLIGPEHPAVRVSWVGVVPRTPVVDPCQSYPTPPIYQ